METQEEAVMSLEKAKAYLEAKGFLDHVIELKDSTATVHEHDIPRSALNLQASHKELFYRCRYLLQRG